MLESPAYRVLSLSARRILDRIEIEMAHHGGVDYGHLPVTFNDFERYGIERHAIAPAMREVEALGLIEITQRGCAGNAEHRSPNIFRLTYRQTKHGNPTNEWRRIGTIEQAIAAAKQARGKTESQWGKKPKPSAGNPHRNGKSPVRETPTTGQGGETPTTLDISGV